MLQIPARRLEPKVHRPICSAVVDSRQVVEKTPQRPAMELEGEKQGFLASNAAGEVTSTDQVLCGGCGEGMLAIARFCTGCGFQNAATTGKGEFSVMEQLQILNLQVQLWKANVDSSCWLYRSPLTPFTPRYA